jgi:hypothetical protein
MADITSIGNNMLGETEYRYENWIDPFLIGHWEIKDSPEIWSAYSVFAIYSDGYEAGISYRLTGDSLFTGMGDVNIIEKLTETELITRSANDSIRNHWLRTFWE